MSFEFFADDMLIFIEKYIRKWISILISFFKLIIFIQFLLYALLFNLPKNLVIQSSLSDKISKDEEFSLCKWNRRFVPCFIFIRTIVSIQLTIWIAQRFTKSRNDNSNCLPIINYNTNLITREIFNNKKLSYIWIDIPLYFNNIIWNKRFISWLSWIINDS